MNGLWSGGRTCWAFVVAGAGMTVLSSAVAVAMAFPAQPTGPAPAAPRVAAMYFLPPVAIELAPVPVTRTSAAGTPGAGATAAAAAAAAPPGAGPAAAAAAAATPPPAPADALALPPSAPTVSSDCSGAAWEQRRGEAARSQLRHVAATRSVPVTFRAGRSNVLGMANLDTRSVEVFVRSCTNESDALLRHVLAHELGHVLDEVRMNDERRAQWKALRGIPAGTPWYGCSACSDFATPAGDFAEVYAQWARGATSNNSQLAGSPGPAALERLAADFFGA